MELCKGLQRKFKFRVPQKCGPLQCLSYRRAINLSQVSSDFCKSVKRLRYTMSSLSMHFFYVFLFSLEISCNSIFAIHLNSFQHSNIQLTYVKGFSFVSKYCQFTQAMLTRCPRKIHPKKENMANCLQACKIKVKVLASSLLNNSHIINWYIGQILIIVKQIHLIFHSF